jgi:uncharacterized membrane protein
LFGLLSTESFYSVWYWALTVYVWTLVCHRTLGVPYDMILRAERLPEVAEEVDRLAWIGIARIAAAARGLGVLAAAGAGFALAVLATLGFGLGSEIAQAGFMLLAPLALVAAATARLALRLARAQATGSELRRCLARRRLWNQVIALAAILAAAVVALGHHPL